MRGLPILLFVALLAGCAGTPGTPTPETPVAAQGGETPAPFRCDEGEAVVGFDARGAPICEPFARADTGANAVQEASTTLQVTSVYGVRSTTTGPIETLKVQLMLAPGSAPLDMRETVVRVSDGTNVGTYAAQGATTGGAFDATWIRGSGYGGVMEQTDLVQLSFDPPAPIPTRSEVQMVIVPSVGSGVAADFKTPPTYGTYTTIALR